MSTSRDGNAPWKSPPPKSEPAAAGPSRVMSPPGSEGRVTPSGSRREVNADARRARRAELRQFYGIKEAVTSPTKSSAGQEDGQEVLKPDSGDPLDIDSPNFNASKYYENLITTSSLADLMKTANTLSADIGNLQGSRHALVYNHHHQLFSAGDTIAQLNSRTPQLLGIMTSLQDSFSEISRLVDAIALPNEAAADNETPKR